MNVEELLSKPWADILPKAEELLAPISKQIKQEREHGIIILPEREKIFRVFHEVPPDKVRVLILGQDPYHNPIGQATGLTKCI